jgi:hypothetical protein
MTILVVSVRGNPHALEISSRLLEPQPQKLAANSIIASHDYKHACKYEDPYQDCEYLVARLDHKSALAVLSAEDGGTNGYAVRVASLIWNLGSRTEVGRQGRWRLEGSGCHH